MNDNINKKNDLCKKISKKNKKLHKNIQSELLIKKITQTEVAEKLGITSATLSEQLKKLSDGKSILTETLFKIAYALEIEVTELLK